MRRRIYPILDYDRTQPAVIEPSNVYRTIDVSVYYWGRGFGFMEVDSQGNQIWQKSICLGTPQLIRGGIQRLIDRSRAGP
ncbi:MAG: hypothetical protein GYA46_03350 [candidate division Zixibacteria bacterium]|nr:hypothetical protein [candidate division Zixibacteria bacterium]